MSEDVTKPELTMCAFASVCVWLCVSCDLLWVTQVMLRANMSPICLSAERCRGEDAVTSTQVEPGPQRGQIKGAVHLKTNTTSSLLTLLLIYYFICLLSSEVPFIFRQTCTVMWARIVLGTLRWRCIQVLLSNCGHLCQSKSVQLISSVFHCTHQDDC